MPVGPAGPATPEELDAFTDLVDRWARAELARPGGQVLAVDRDPDLRRWYVRIRGEAKLVTTVWLTLRQRTLHVEAYFMPGPEENVAECFDYLLRTNNRLYGLRFALGAEEAIYLVGQVPLAALDEVELDRVVGAAYAYSEECFASAMSIGYASKFRR
ncbi:MAG TPA: YbjN domain-containing protein [Acidimicrobiales bacterium]|nr:YbjN domain-containing protein [Acidimicrobiales bacterium]